MRRSWHVIREGVAASLGQPVASIVAIVMIVGMCAAVLLTQGRTIGAQQAVVATLDDAGTRSIVVHAEPAAGLDASVIERIAGTSSMDSQFGFGPATDANNSAVPGGPRAALRLGYGIDLTDFGIEEAGLPGSAYASPEALAQLGMDSVAGSITTAEGIQYPVSGMLTVPDSLAFLEPLVVVPIDSGLSDGIAAQSERGAPLAVLVVIAKDASQVVDLTTTVLSVLDVTDSQFVTIETSRQLAQLRELVDSQLAGVSQTLTLAIFAVTAILVAAILTALVMMRRKDYGRRRALGASQRLIIGLVIAQTGLLSAVGAVLGVLVAFCVLALGGDPQPPTGYFVAIGVLACATGTLASIIPAVLAARRDPARELRVP